MLAFAIQPEFYHSRTSLKLDGFQVGGVLLEGGLLGLNMKISGLPVGSFELLDAGANPGDPVSGRFRADIYKLSE